MKDLFDAVALGDLDTVKELLSQGCNWNSMMDGKSLGDVALENGCMQVYDFLVQEGARTEFLLNILTINQSADISNKDYLYSKLEITESRILDEEQNGVMMGLLL
jgi:hypothetical protein